MKNRNAKYQRPYDLNMQVRLAMRVANHKQKDVEDLTGVDQSHISRILNGKYIRKGRAVRKLEKYANMQLSAEPEKLQGEIRKRIQKTVDELWDGSVEEGRNILYLLELMKNLMRKKRPEGSNG